MPPKSSCAKPSRCRHRDASFHYDLALALKLKDDLPAAIAEMQKSIDLDPNLVDAYYTFGITLWQQGEFPEAVKKLKKGHRAEA